MLLRMGFIRRIRAQDLLGLYLCLMNRTMKSVFAILLALSASSPGFAQVITDGEFSDWTFINPISDPTGDQQYFDLTEARVFNDSLALHFYIQGADYWQLNSDYGLTLYIDTDFDDQTGTAIADLGADLVWNFAQRNGTWQGAAVEHSDVGMYSAPTVTSDRFEVAFSKHNGLQFGDSIRFVWAVFQGADDLLPDSGSITYRQFNGSYSYTPIDVSRDNASALRLMTYNVEHDGLGEPQHAPALARMIAAAHPDIITFNELWDTDASFVASFLDSILPLNGAMWQAAKLFNGNVTASRYPIIQSLEFAPGDRVLVTVIDLPPSFSTDMVVANLHLKCCNDDDRRQDQVDNFVEFYRDLQTPLGNLNLPFGTPFIVAGDMNLVGDQSQLNTLLTGDVVQENEYGFDFDPDWDGTSIRDVFPYHSDQRHAYTWPGQGSSFYPGRLDYIFYSDYTLQVAKSFILNTTGMSATRLSALGLLPNDAHTASDHLPVVADFIWNNVSGSLKIEKPELNIRPNPAEEAATLSWEKGDIKTIEIRDGQGKLLGQFTIGPEENGMLLDLTTYSAQPLWIIANGRFAYPLIAQ